MRSLWNLTLLWLQSRTLTIQTTAWWNSDQVWTRMAGSILFKLNLMNTWKFLRKGNFCNGLFLFFLFINNYINSKLQFFISKRITELLQYTLNETFCLFIILYAKKTIMPMHHYKEITKFYTLKIIYI